ncbi:hypothetical protein D3C81_2219950 [compost metagenome]
MYGRRWKQQQITGLNREGLIALEDLPLALDGQIDDEALHAAGSIDDEIERTVFLDRRHV